jgi:hypothetical protein
MLCFKVLAIDGLERLAKNSSISLAFSNEANWKREEPNKKRKSDEHINN